MTPKGSPLPAMSLGVALLLGWWLIARTGALPTYVLPEPLKVAQRLWLGVTQSNLLPAAATTLEEALLGCLLAAATALPLAWALAHWQLFARTVLPYVAASQAVPAIALAPLFVVWFGYGTWPVVLLCAFMVFFPITVTTLVGLRGLDPDIMDAARLDGAHGLQLIQHLEVPLALPSILAGLRTGFTLSITGAVVGEMTMGGTGLGMVLASQRQSADTTGLFATITLLCVLATTIHACLHQLEQRSRVVADVRGQRDH
ncbi:ABC transporter permease [Actinomyces bovis]|nr:ABC transporter permease [Actinomyces bovis]